MATKPRDKHFLREISWTLLANVWLLLVLLISAYFANHIPMVAQSPVRYSILLVPFSLSAVLAALISFVPYFSLPRMQSLIPLLGIFLAGIAASLFFYPFENYHISSIETSYARIAEYSHRVDVIAYLITSFSIATALCSLLKFYQVKKTVDTSSKEIEASPEYWVLKLWICDIPIALGALVIVCMSFSSLNLSSQNFSEVYHQIFSVVKPQLLSSPDSFAAEELRLRYANANFWFGVAFGVTSAQLIVQQLGSLFLEATLVWRRRAGDR